MCHGNFNAWHFLADRKIITSIWGKTYIMDVMERIVILKRSWAGYMARADKDRWTTNLLQWRHGLTIIGGRVDMDKRSPK